MDEKIDDIDDLKEEISLLKEENGTLKLKIKDLENLVRKYEKAIIDHFCEE